MAEKYYIYAEREKLDTSVIANILESDTPKETFQETIMSMYDESTYENDIIQLLKQKYPTLSEEKLFEKIYEEYEIEYPFNHFLKQTVYLNIFLDTGDGNYDFVLNAAHVPHYNGTEDDMDEKASIVWLAKQQGYTAEKLNQYLSQEYKDVNTKTFLGSIWQEIANANSSLLTTAFLIETTLETAININNILHEKNNENKSIILDKNVICGLYDPWGGSGSLFEIKLEKNVEIPFNIIRSASVDGYDGYSISYCYGTDNSLWKKAIIKIKME